MFVTAADPPLVTAASYGEVDMARRLIAPGADLEATGVAISGGTALTHAVEFGNTEVVDEAAAAGAVVHDVVEAGGVSEVPIGSRAQAA
jgi:ankyrin repeat protein